MSTAPGRGKGTGLSISRKGPEGWKQMQELQGDRILWVAYRRLSRILFPELRLRNHSSGFIAWIIRSFYLGDGAWREGLLKVGRVCRYVWVMLQKYLCSFTPVFLPAVTSQRGPLLGGIAIMLEASLTVLRHHWVFLRIVWLLRRRKALALTLSVQLNAFSFFSHHTGGRRHQNHCVLFALLTMQKWGDAFFAIISIWKCGF